MIVISFAALLLIFFGIFGTVKSGQIVLQSKDVRRYMATNLGEAALACIIAELNANRAFSTHWHYRERDNEFWHSPIKKRETLLGDMGSIYVSGVTDGIYYGGSDAGEFKAKIAPMYGTREDSKTQTLLEGEMYTRAEIMAKIGGGWGSNEKTYRKITALIERRYPATESILYDGEMLDLGALGPYDRRENVLRRGRLYGYHYITFNTGGGSCRGSELFEMEKIESPGMIRALKDTRISFADDSSTVLSSQNDSINVGEFETHDGFLVDGNHGAHPIKFTRLPRERIKATAHRYRKTYGVTLLEGDLPYGNYENPYDPSTRYVDLDFGDFRVSRSATRNDELDEDDSIDAGDGTDYSTGSDDPQIIRERRGSKILVYAEVPLRIWGCPDRTITIYSTSDIVIAGDFNQSPTTPQVYDDDTFMNYSFEIANGKGRNKVGALIMSEGRVLIDISRPTLFAKNEIKPYFLYSLAYALNPSSPEVEREIKPSLAPINSNNRRSIVGLGEMGTDGNFLPRYGTIAWLYNNKNTNSGGSYSINMEDLIQFFTPGFGGKPRFGIRDDRARNELIEYFKNVVRVAGDLTVVEQDRIFEMAWKQAVLEEEKSPSTDSGAMGIMRSLFEEASKDSRDGIYLPEITINATLVSSARRAASWRIGNSPDKYDDEIGNAGSMAYLKDPGFIIQRVYGGVIRLATKEPDYFISGAHTARNTLRRRIWDPTNLRNQKFRPVEVPAVHNLLTFSDRMVAAKEFEEFQ